MKLLLICNTAIIEHIFNLVCKRLSIDLIIEKNTKIKDKYDFIVVDQPFIGNNSASLRKLAKMLLFISSEEIDYNLQKDYLIPRPFLPTKLEAILKEQIEILKQKIENNHNLVDFVEETKVNLDSKNSEIVEDKEDETLSEDFFETLIDDDFDSSFFSDDKNSDDESIISLDSIRQGGVLDANEIKKINNVLNEDSESTEEVEVKVIDDSDWKDISEIIDDALEEVKEFEFEISKEDYHLILNRHKMDDIKPLLLKLNQDLIDRLTRNETINLKISLKES